MFRLLLIPRPPRSTLFPCTTLFRSRGDQLRHAELAARRVPRRRPGRPARGRGEGLLPGRCPPPLARAGAGEPGGPRSEEHTSELQSRQYLACRLLLEKKKTGIIIRD